MKTLFNQAVNNIDNNIDIQKILTLISNMDTSSVMVAGGYFRDIILGCYPSDIDVFVTINGDLDRQHRELLKALDRENIEFEMLSMFGYRYTKRDMRQFKVFSGIPINVIVQCYENPITPREIINDFSADWSKLGIIISEDGHYINEEVTDGLKAIERGVITFKGDQLNPLIKYILKISNKPWFLDTIVVYDHFGYRKEIIKASEIDTDNLHELVSRVSDELIPGLVSEYGLFHANTQSTVPEGYVEFLNGLNCYLNYAYKNSALIRPMMQDEDYVRIIEEGYNISRDYASFFESMRGGSSEWLFQKFLKSIYDEQYKIYNYTTPIDSKGWDFIKDLSEERRELYFSGKKRLALNFEDGYLPHNITNKLLVEMLKLNGFSKNLPLYESSVQYKLNPYLVATDPIKIKANVLRGFVAEDVHHLLQVINWAHTLGYSATLLSRYWLQHYDYEYASIVIPEKFKKSLATNHQALRWVYEQKLSVNWSFSNSVRKNVVEAIRREYDVSEVIAESLYDEPNSLEALKFAKDNPNAHIKLNEVFPTKKYETEKYTLEMLDKTDLINLNIGTLTSCCQHFSGVGREVCKEGWIDPNSVNYVVRSKSGNIYAHFWAWASQQGHIVIDSVEGKNDPELIEHTAELIKMFSENENVMISATSYGMTADVREILGVTGSIQCPAPHYHYSYMDGSFVSLLSECVEIDRTLEATESLQYVGESDDIWF